MYPTKRAILPERLPAGRIERPNRVSTGVVEHPIGDNRGAAAVGAGPHGVQVRNATTGDAQLEARDAVVVGDKDPGPAIARVDPPRRSRFHFAALWHVHNRARRSAGMAGAA